MEKEKILLKAVLAFSITQTHILLAYKTQKIGKGKWNGYGGGIKNGEDPYAAIIRELKEESKLSVKKENLKKVAVMDFHNQTEEGQRFNCRVHIFFFEEYSGIIKATKEMDAPTWFLKDNIPYDQMMPADPFWLPNIISGKLIYGEAWLGPHQKELIGSVIIREVSEKELEKF